MKAVFLVIDYVPHQILSIKNLIEKANADVLAFHVGRFNNTIPNNLHNFSTHYYRDFSKNELLEQVKSYSPDIVITAGWMISEYNWVCKQVKKATAIPIVAMSDTPWYGTWKQKINAWMGPFHVKRAFTHLWVAGVRQYEYARRLGFCNDQIIFNSLSANTDIFNQVDINHKTTYYPRNFLYVGNFLEIKGINNLKEAWNQIEDKKGWTFTLVGRGELKDNIESNGGFIIKDYMSQNELLNEFKNAGCFVLPSLREQWGVVLHEAAAAGLPIICTETCGAAPHFVIDHYSGFRVKNNSVEDLRIKLETVINMSPVESIFMGNNSRKLSHSISLEMQTASLMQLIK